MAYSLKFYSILIALLRRILALLALVIGSFYFFTAWYQPVINQLTPLHLEGLQGQLAHRLTCKKLTIGPITWDHLILTHQHTTDWKIQANLVSPTRRKVKMHGDLSLKKQKMTAHLGAIPLSDWWPITLTIPKSHWQLSPTGITITLAKHTPLTGRLDWRSHQHWQLVLNHGNDHLLIKRRRHHHSHLRLNIDHLSNYSPLASGNLHTTGIIIPGKIEAKLNANAIKLPHLAIEKAQLLIKGSQYNQLQGQLRIQLHDSPIPNLRTLTLSLTPHPNQSLSWQFSGDAKDWQLRSQGNWQIDRWQQGSLTVTALEAKENDHLRWQLNTPSQIDYTGRTWRASPFCLQASKASLCWQTNPKNEFILSRFPLALLSPLLTQHNAVIRDLSGFATGKLSRATTSHWPTGKLTLTDVSFSVPILGTTWKKGHLSLHTHGQHVSYQGHISSNQKPINIKGNWSPDSQKGVHQVIGHNIPLIQTTHAQLNSDIDCQVKTNGQHTRLMGKATILSGHISQPDYSAVTHLPKNTRIIRRFKAPSPKPTFPLTGSFHVTIPQGIPVETLGIVGKLTGKITLFRDHQMPWLVTGDAELHDPHYLRLPEAQLTHAKLFYENDALTDPHLDIQLKRIANLRPTIDFDNTNTTFDPLTVFLDIKGNLSHPRYTLHASQSMNRAAMLSALLTGETTLNPFSGLSLASTLSTNPVHPHLNPIGQIKRALRLQEFSLSSANNTLGTSFTEDNYEPQITLRKSIGQRLDLYSQVGFLDNTYTLALIYHFMKQRFNSLIYVNETGFGGQLLYRWENSTKNHE